MSTRDDGFAIADISTTLLDDAKVRKLARRCLDDGELAPSIVVYMATLLASWREGRRLTATEAESWVDPTEERLAHLQAVNLLDVESRVPESAWERHFRPAWERREKARTAGRIGNERRWGPDANPIATPSRPNPRQTDRPTDLPTGRQKPNGKAIEEERPFVTLTDAEKAAALQAEKDEAIAKTLNRLGLPVEVVDAA